MTTDAHRNFFTGITRHIEARKAWEAENPEMATAWNEAVAEDESRSRAKEAAKAAELARRAAIAALLDIGAPLRAIRALEAPQDTEAAQLVKAGGSGVTLLSGPAGTGKTVAAVQVAHRAMTEAMAKNPERTKETPGRTARFVRAVTLARCSAYGPEAAETLEAVTSTRLLVLDDLGAEYASPVWDMLLFEVLDVRHGAMLPTIITTNLARDALKTRYGERFAERIREGGKAHFLNGESMRGQS